jgi:hypothetical protein
MINKSRKAKKKAGEEKQEHIIYKHSWSGDGDKQPA